jgi:hypothetical protein
MMELMNELGLELNEGRRREVALDDMRALRAPRGSSWTRQAAGNALVALGGWLEGSPSTTSLSPATAKISGDCV